MSRDECDLSPDYVCFVVTIDSTVNQSVLVFLARQSSTIFIIWLSNDSIDFYDPRLFLILSAGSKLLSKFFNWFIIRQYAVS